jgi:hypothetical protein
MPESFQHYWYNGHPVRRHPGLPHWLVVEDLRPPGSDAALHIALFSAGEGEVRAEVHWLRRDRDAAVAELWRRGDPETLLWRREYSPAVPGWHPYRDVLGEVVRVTGQPLPAELAGHVARVEAEERPGRAPGSSAAALTPADRPGDGAAQPGPGGHPAGPAPAEVPRRGAAGSGPAPGRQQAQGRPPRRRR